jgi:hypothetical protein
MPKQATTRALLIVAAALNIIPLAYSGLILRAGTVAGGDTDARLRFIAGHAVWWSAGWFAWMAGSVGLTLSIWVLARVFLATTRMPEALRFATIAATIGATVDIVGDAIQATTFPTLASQYVALAPADPARGTVTLLFDLADHLSSALSAGVANTIYFVAGALVVVALATIDDFPRRITVLGILAWLVTLLATPAVFFPGLIAVAVAGSLGLYALWLVAIAIWGLGEVNVRLPLPHLHRV